MHLHAELSSKVDAGCNVTNESSIKVSSWQSRSTSIPLNSIHKSSINISLSAQITFSPQHCGWVTQESSKSSTRRCRNCAGRTVQFEPSLLPANFVAWANKFSLISTSLQFSESNSVCLCFKFPFMKFSTLPRLLWCERVFMTFLPTRNSYNRKGSRPINLF